MLDLLFYQPAEPDRIDHDDDGICRLAFIGSMAFLVYYAGVVAAYAAGWL